MSCPTQSLSLVNMSVTMGSLPEGYCPESYQALAEAIVARLVVTPSQAFSTFVTGPTSPTSNQGPWLKNCEEWFVWDDNTSSYIPVAKGGFNAQVYYSASNTFVVPSNIYKLKVHAWGAGGGAADSDGTFPGSGGGGGAYGCSIVNVTPGQSIAFTIGAGGANGNPAVDGGDTTILGRTSGGGKKGETGSGNKAGGAGGAASGFEINFTGGPGRDMLSNSGIMGGSGGNGAGGGGMGGSESSDNAHTTKVGVAPGGGGGGALGTAGALGGTGADGGVLFEY